MLERLEVFRPFILAFIPIFIAIDILGNIPLFLSISEKFSHKQKKRLIRESIAIAFILTIIFVSVGKYVFRIIGITISDFKIAGGILLLSLSINFLLSRQGTKFSYRGSRHMHDIGIFPLATPLIAGPALLTISLIVLENFGIAVALSALILNMLLAWVILDKSEIINKFIGEKGIKSLSKIFEILLATVATMMIRQGIMDIFFK